LLCQHLLPLRVSLCRCFSCYSVHLGTAGGTTLAAGRLGRLLLLLLLLFLRLLCQRLQLLCCCRHLLCQQLSLLLLLLLCQPLLPLLLLLLLDQLLLLCCPAWSQQVYPHPALQGCAGCVPAGVQGEVLVGASIQGEADDGAMTHRGLLLDINA
jgi:hypothetical protein